jgi:hypothetical protein
MSSATKTLKYADLERFLTHVGFTAERGGPTYLLFRYSSPEVMIVLPSRRAEDPVDAAHLLAVRKHVLENGLLDEASFERLLWGTGPTVASQ